MNMHIFAKSVTAIGFSIALAGGAAALRAQESAAVAPSKVERKERAPVSREILRVKLPKPVQAKLKNGLTVLILEDHRAPFINLQLHLGGAGALFEPANMAGLANATAQMLREGTTTRSSLQLAEEIDQIGRASCRERV